MPFRFFRNVSSLLALLPLSAISTLVGQTAANTIPSNTIGPRAEFSDSVVDFGLVAPTEIRRHDFVVTNTGAEPLVISNVSPGCGCTTAGEWDREIAPGRAGKIPVAFNPANFSGAVIKTILVVSNDPTQPTRTLEIRATVRRPFQIQPAFANFLPVAGEAASETKVIRIVNTADEPAILQPPTSTDPRFKTDLKTIREGKEFELQVSYTSTTDSVSPSATITIGTSSKDQPVLTITAFAMPQPAVVVIPSTLQLPATSNGQNYSHNIVIRNNSSISIRVTDALVSAEGVTARITEPQPGKIFYVNVAIPHGFNPPSDRPAVVSVKTSHPRFPEIRVPIVPPHAATMVPEVNRNRTEE